LSLLSASVLFIAPFGLYCVPDSHSKLSVFFKEADVFRTGAMMIQLFIPGAVMLIMAVARAELMGDVRFLRSSVLVYLGEASFALYMTHALFLGFFTWQFLSLFPVTRTSWVQGDVARIIYATYAVLISCAVHQWVEIPARRFLLEKFFDPQK
jgi:peptidoglycan/LPS O-acetylase OafA/YrhL